jgi:hypothetical protein
MRVNLGKESSHISSLHHSSSINNHNDIFDISSDYYSWESDISSVSVASLMSSSW